MKERGRLPLSNLKSESLNLHRKHQGKLQIQSKVPIHTARDLSLAYSPGVAEPCLEIFENPEKVYDYTIKGNLVAVISNGTAVLGLGNIGASAAIPVMEGKAALFKAFANIDAFPLCLDTCDIEQFIETVKLLEPMFGGINLEDIAAPHCFIIEEKLKKAMSIPIFHDDQHGTAIVVTAGLINALKLVQKEMEEISVVINGAGAAGVAITRILLLLGVKDITLCDTKGAIFEGRLHGMNPVKDEIAKMTNKERRQGSLAEILNVADVFIGVSKAGILTKEMIQSMNRDPIVFALANPTPEVMPEAAKEAGVAVIATGRSDYPNQINNVLAFPGIFRGALDVLATNINEEMKLAAAFAIANLVEDDELTPEYIIPSPFDKRVAPYVANAVSKAAVSTGVARKPLETFLDDPQLDLKI
jgi:malate dehydrogenase (oxaloacetate-decarboxylating)